MPTSHCRLVLQDGWVRHHGNRPGQHGLVMAPAIPAHSGWRKTETGGFQTFPILTLRHTFPEEDFPVLFAGKGLQFANEASTKPFFVKIPSKEKIPFFFCGSGKIANPIVCNAQANGAQFGNIPVSRAAGVKPGQNSSGTPVGLGIPSGWCEKIPQGDFRQGMEFPDKTGVAAAIKPVRARKKTTVIRAVDQGDRDILTHGFGKKGQNQKVRWIFPMGSDQAGQSSRPSSPIRKSRILACRHHQ